MATKSDRLLIVPQDTAVPLQPVFGVRFMLTGFQEKVSSPLTSVK